MNTAKGGERVNTLGAISLAVSAASLAVNAAALALRVLELRRGRGRRRKG